MSHRNIFVSVIAVIVCCSLCSCNKDEGTTGVDNTEPTIYRHAFFPLAVGNTWSYVDSLLTNADTTVETFSISIVSFRADTFGTWWKFQSSRYTSGYLYEFMERNDSVYSFQHNFQFPVVSLEYIPRPVSDTSFFYSLFGGDVLLQKAAVGLQYDYSTPARSFDSCALYFFRIAESREWDVIRPRIGLVGYDMQVDSFYNHGASFRKVRLTSYNLKQ